MLRVKVPRGFLFNVTHFANCLWLFVILKQIYEKNT